MEKTNYRCVVTNSKQYVTVVETMCNEKGIINPVNHVLKDGESLLDISPPPVKLCTGAPGLIHPQADIDTMSWEEAATLDEIAEWELLHPALLT